MAFSRSENKTVTSTEASRRLDPLRYTCHSRPVSGYRNSSLEGSDILVATGRIPDTAGIGLDTVGAPLPARFVPAWRYLCHPRGTRPFTLPALPSDRLARPIHKSFLFPSLRGGATKFSSPERPLPWSTAGKGNSKRGDHHPRPTGVPSFRLGKEGCNHVPGFCLPHHA
jgi:hypothetical protein